MASEQNADMEKNNAPNNPPKKNPMGRTNPPTTAPAAKKKPGNKGDFHGKREEYLVGKMDEYLSYSKKGKTRDFYPLLFKTYWAMFNWRLPLNEDPSPGDQFPPDATKLTQEESDAKSKTQTQTQRKIKSWYNHRRTAMGLTKNPFTPWLARLRRPEEKAPKRITDYQYYMQHEEFKAQVMGLFEERHWDAPRDEQLARRCEVARELFKKEPQSVKERIRAEAEAELQAEKTRWEEASEGLPSLEDAEQEEARARFTGVVTPLLQALRAYTGYHVTIIAGRVVDGQFDMRSVHAGKTNAATGDEGVDWTDWDKKGYKDHVLDQFMRYLVAADRAPGVAPVAPDVNESTEADVRSASTNQPVPSDANASTNQPVPFDANASTSQPVPSDANASTNQPASSSTPPASDLPPLDNDDDPPASLILSSPSEDPSTSLNARPPPPPPSSQPPREDEPGHAGMLEERMDALPTLEAGLRSILMALDPEARERRLGELEHMSVVQLRRANNVAHSEWELAKVRAEKGGGEPIPPPVAEAGKGKSRKKAAKAAPRKRNQKGRRDKADEEESAEESNSDVDDGTEPTRREPPQTRQRKAAVTTVATGGGDITEQRVESDATATTPNANTARDKAAATTAPGARKAQASNGAAASTRRDLPRKSFPVTKAPKWAQNARATLLNADFSSEQSWIEAIVAWWALEASTKFASPVRGFPAEGRPGEIQMWIKYARGTKPEIKNIGEFVEKVQNWWKKINPAWRLKDGRLTKATEGSWAEMRKPGPNGFLGVLACLKWWREEKGSTREWVDALEDVTWVLRTLLMDTSGDGDEDEDANDMMQGVVEYGAASGTGGVEGGSVSGPGGVGNVGHGGDEMEVDVA
ncbi:hypothetical protein C8R47DRAFT_1218593 [Mycena vitilis]|nr:hypothetical protein C8R47DRAFT_1218593 [Mycena vitilis]